MIIEKFPYEMNCQILHLLTTKELFKLRELSKKTKNFIESYRGWKSCFVKDFGNECKLLCSLSCVNFFELYKVKKNQEYCKNVLIPEALKIENLNRLKFSVYVTIGSSVFAGIIPIVLTKCFGVEGQNLLEKYNHNGNYEYEPICGSDFFSISGSDL